MPFKIGLLLCGTVNPSARKLFGDYERIFSSRILAVFKRYYPSIDVVIVSFKVKDGEFPSDVHTFDAFVVTGSKADAYRLDIEWIRDLNEFIKNTCSVYPHIRWVGICFGHQMIAQAFGSKVKKNENDWEIGRISVKLNNEGQSFFGKQCLNVISVHQDHVQSVPPGFVLLGGTENTPIQAMLKPGHILTVQFHPEYNSSIIDIILKFDPSRFKEVIVNKAYSTLYNHTDDLFPNIVEFLLKSISKL